MVYLWGVGEVPISISSDPKDGTRLTHTIRAVGNVTEALCRLNAGSSVGLRGPFGNSWPIDDAVGKDVIIVAGGIGLAPLRPSIYHILNQRERFGSVTLLYGIRTPSDILFRKELETWRARLDLDVHVTVDRAGSDWRGNVGVVTTLLPRASFDPENAVAMLCGPEVMMRYGALSLLKQRMPKDNIYISMERNMKCAIGLCGHCQFGDLFVCKDGPVFTYERVRGMLTTWEL
jgi:NAD(P)H-flavin reductase